MTHLFLAYSGLQLMVAQLIANRLPDGSRRVLWLSTPSPGSPQRQTIEAIVLARLWTEIRWVDLNHRLRRPRSSSVLLKPLATLRALREACGQSDRAIRELAPDRVYLPHALEWSCRAIAHAARSDGRQVSLFEEGLGLYHMSESPRDLTGPARLAAAAASWAAMGVLSVAGFGRLLGDISGNVDDLFCFFPEASHIVEPSRGFLDLRTIRDDRLLNEMADSIAFAPTRARLRSLRRPGRTLLFISSVDVEDQLVDGQVYREAILKFLRRMAESYDNILFKLHPRNDRSRVDELLRATGTPIVPVDETISIPVELCWPDFSADAVAGTHTSPLVYLPLLYGVRSMSAIPLVLSTGYAMNRRMERYSVMAARFSEAFGGIVQMVNDR